MNDKDPKAFPRDRNLELVGMSREYKHESMGIPRNSQNGIIGIHRASKKVMTGLQSDRHIRKMQKNVCCLS